MTRPWAWVTGGAAVALSAWFLLRADLGPLFIGLIAIMFSLGMSLTVKDFKRVGQRAKSVAVGLGGQLLLLPVLGFGVALLFRSTSCAHLC